MTIAAVTSAPTTVRRDRAFYTGMSVASAITVFVGFGRSYFLKGYFGAPPLTPLVHLHGLVFTGWICLFLAQVLLVAKQRVALHRRLGILGGIWATILVLVGLATAVASARRNFPAGGDQTLAFLAVPLTDMFVFAVLVTAGLLFRRKPEVHKRLMLVATIGLLSAAIARWPLAIMQKGPVAFFVVTDLYLLAGIGYDLAARRRIHPAYLWGGLLLVVSQPLRLAISHTDTWLAFTARLVH